jgi:hypothetical protein
VDAGWVGDRCPDAEGSAHSRRKSLPSLSIVTHHLAEGGAHTLERRQARRQALARPLAPRLWSTRLSSVGVHDGSSTHTRRLQTHGCPDPDWFRCPHGTRHGRGVCQLAHAVHGGSRLAECILRRRHGRSEPERPTRRRLRWFVGISPSLPIVAHHLAEGGRHGNRVDGCSGDTTLAHTGDRH